MILLVLVFLPALGGPNVLGMIVTPIRLAFADLIGVRGLF
jgi:hypothetical protein